MRTTCAASKSAEQWNGRRGAAPVPVPRTIISEAWAFAWRVVKKGGVVFC